MNLLNGEIAFNGELGATLERLQAVKQTLELGQTAVLDDRLIDAVDLIEQADESSKSLSLTKSTRVAGAFEAKTTDLRNHVKEKLIYHWNQLIVLDSAKPSIQVRQQANSIAQR